MLDRIIIGFIKVKKRIINVIDSKSAWIMTLKDNEIYVEREFGIEEDLDLDFSMNDEEIQQIWREFINAPVVNITDFVREEERNVFLISLFAELPFVKVTKIKR